MQTWILDLLVNEVELHSSCADEVHGAVWLVMSADGLSSPFSTPTRSLSSRPAFNFPARLFLKIPDLQNAYLFVTLCTYGPDGAGAIPLARSRVGLRSLPNGFPKQFRFPLMKYQNGAQQSAVLSVKATMSQVSGVPNSYPGVARPSVNSDRAAELAQSNRV
jgi:hypothetical protein